MGSRCQCHCYCHCQCQCQRQQRHMPLGAHTQLCEPKSQKELKREQQEGGSSARDGAGAVPGAAAVAEAVAGVTVCLRLSLNANLCLYLNVKYCKCQTPRLIPGKRDGFRQTILQLQLPRQLPFSYVAAVVVVVTPSMRHVCAPLSFSFSSSSDSVRFQHVPFAICHVPCAMCHVPCAMCALCPS